MKVLIVGNGSSALAKEVGKEIDSFDGLVVRLNNYTIKGFEKWVGTRTDVWVSVERFANLINDFHQKRYFYSYRFDDKTQDVINFLRAERLPIEYGRIASERMRYYHPSLGAVVTTFYLEQGHEVYLWGFDFFAERRPHHYNNDGVKIGAWHDRRAEWLFFNQLLDDGKVKYFAHDKSKESIPIVRTPVPCGKPEDLSWYREPAHQAWYEWFAGQMSGSVLDVGAGTCKGIELLISKGLSATGLENDKRLEGKHPNLKIGDLSMFPDKSFDYCTCVDVIEHIVDDVTAINHMKRIARKGIFLTTPNYTRSGCGNIAHCREYTMAQFANLFMPDEVWSASPDGSLHKTLVLERVGEYYIDHSPEGADNTKHMTLLAYKGRVPIDTRFNYTVDGEEWACICGIWRF